MRAVAEAGRWMFLVMSMVVNNNGGMMPRTWTTMVEEVYQESALTNMFVAGRWRGLGGGVSVFRPQQATQVSVMEVSTRPGGRMATGMQEQA